MDPRKLFYDERLKVCVYCGGTPDTVDHVPSKVLLDEPYPPNLPVVGCCESCNNSFSVDERYVACLLECAALGSCEPAGLMREKVRRLMSEKRHLRRTLEAACTLGAHGRVTFRPDPERLQAVVMKLARGHFSFACGEIVLQPPIGIAIVPLHELSDRERRCFEEEPVQDVLPELGSLTFHEALGLGDTAITNEGWQVVQPHRYRYLVSWTSETLVRCVLGEYLACEVRW